MPMYRVPERDNSSDLAACEKGNNSSCLSLDKKSQTSLLFRFILLSHEEPKHSSAEAQNPEELFYSVLPQYDTFSTKPYEYILPISNTKYQILKADS